MTKKITLSGEGIVTGNDALSYLKNVEYSRAFIVTGGSSMEKNGFLAQVRDNLDQAGCQSLIYSGIKMNPRIQEVMDGVAKIREFNPDLVIGVGGGSAMDAAKAMLLFYEFEDLTFENVLEKNMGGKIPTSRSTGLICIPSTSGTASEVTRGTVITDPVKKLKVPIMTDILRPDIAILDPGITMSMPKRIVAETGMDALTHAIEAYTNHNLDDFTETICRGAIEGIMEWLLISYQEMTIESREKVQNYQAMAGIGFANVGLGMVHGIAHAYGAMFDLAHGLTNAIILPYVLEYNRQNPIVDKKLCKLEFHCQCDNIIEEINELNNRMKIPASFKEAGISEEEFLQSFELLLDHSMLGATKVNPVEMDRESMREMVNLVYYGKKGK